MVCFGYQQYIWEYIYISLYLVIISIFSLFPAICISHINTVCPGSYTYCIEWATASLTDSMLSLGGTLHPGLQC